MREYAGEELNKADDEVETISSQSEQEIKPINPEVEDKPEPKEAVKVFFYNNNWN